MPPDSLTSTSKQLAKGLMAMYHGDEPGEVPGLLPNSNKVKGYYWWEGGAMMDAMIHYYARTDDDQYNQRVIDAMKFQAGEDDNYQPKNQTKTLVNGPANSFRALPLANAIFASLRATMTRRCGHLPP